MDERGKECSVVLKEKESSCSQEEMKEEGESRQEEEGQIKCRGRNQIFHPLLINDWVSRVSNIWDLEAKCRLCDKALKSGERQEKESTNYAGMLPKKGPFLG